MPMGPMELADRWGSTYDRRRQGIDQEGAEARGMLDRSLPGSRQEDREGIYRRDWQASRARPSVRARAEPGNSRDLKERRRACRRERRRRDLIDAASSSAPACPFRAARASLRETKNSASMGKASQHRGSLRKPATGANARGCRRAIRTAILRRLTWRTSNRAHRGDRVERGGSRRRVNAFASSSVQWRTYGLSMRNWWKIGKLVRSIRSICERGRAAHGREVTKRRFTFVAIDAEAARRFRQRGWAIKS